MDDRSWMYRHIGKKSKHSDEFMSGVGIFLDFAFSHPECVDDGMIRCPCSKCDFVNYQSREEVELCLYRNGFVPNYTKWTEHGELEEQVHNSDADTFEENENWTKDMLRDMTNVVDDFDENPNNESKKFYDLLKAADEPLWEGCQSHTTLSAVTLLLHLKSQYCFSTTGFDAFLLAFKEMLPKNNKLPESFYRCKSLMKDLGQPLEKIHACTNDCILFRKEYADLDTCPICNEARYNSTDRAKGKRSKPIPRKVLSYLPIIPRLQRLYLSSKTAEPMRWHKEKRCDISGELRHPADSEAWKHFDRNYPTFAEDARSIRLGLATDGFNPFGHSAKPHSTWPVFLVPYNLPPWMCMKEEYMFMPLLIPGPHGPGREIDVYLRPLIEELKILWDVGVDTYDAYSKKNFSMKAAVIWTISDFPALGMLKGWSTHGALSCPSCMDPSVAFNLKHGRKPSYFGCHRRWLKRNHRFRGEKAKFNNKTERRNPPPRRTGADELNLLSRFDSVIFGKDKRCSSDKTPGFGIHHNWTKKSIFFELPYWSVLLIRHCLDVMHIEKNVFDNLFYTVMNTSGKTKDHLKARLDLQELGIRPELHPQASVGGKVKLPKAKYTLKSDEIKLVCNWLKSLKVPDGYASNISRCINLESCKIMGLKSHDCHILMQRFLPLAFRDFLPKSIWEPINGLCKFFRDICSKVYKVAEIEKLELYIAEILCKLEMIFPPSFFDSMEHLPIHLAYEAKVGGPSQYRWMYIFERAMCSKKKRVRNKARPESSIVEAHLIDELVYFSSRYFDVKVQNKFSRPDRNDDGGESEISGKLSIFSHPRPGRPFGERTRQDLTDEELEAATIYMLSNCEEVIPFIEEHKCLLKELRPNISDRELQKEHNMTFIKWFEERVNHDNVVDPRLKVLALGPSREVTCYNSFIVNGFKFHTRDSDTGKVSQNSGVSVQGYTFEGQEKNYYGHLVKVIELDYYGKGNSVFLFQCEWYDSEKGVIVDKYGITSIDTKSRHKPFEPFVMASQVIQVFYANPVSTKAKGWSSVIMAKARNTYDVAETSVEETYQEETYQQEEIHDFELYNIDEQLEESLLDDSQLAEEVDASLLECSDEDDNESIAEEDDDIEEDDTSDSEND